MGVRRIVPATGLLTALALACATAAPASAAPGDGPYTPFPEDPTGRALDFVKRLNERRAGAVPEVTAEQLVEGVVVRPSGEPRRRAGRGGRPDGAPFRQAGVVRASDPPSPAAWPFAVLAALLAGGALTLGVGARGASRNRP